MSAPRPLPPPPETPPRSRAHRRVVRAREDRAALALRLRQIDPDAFKVELEKIRALTKETCGEDSETLTPTAKWWGKFVRQIEREEKR